jgi:hypothetical protein
MAYLVVPNRREGASAKIWVGALDEGVDGAEMVLEGAGAPRRIPGWQPWGSCPPRVRYAIVRSMVSSLAGDTISPCASMVRSEPWAA